MSNSTVVEVWGSSKEAGGLYGVVKTRQFPPENNRSIGRFIKKWKKRFDSTGQRYEIHTQGSAKDEMENLAKTLSDAGKSLNDFPEKLANIFGWTGSLGVNANLLELAF
jgi:hypothetical protein